MNLIPFAVALSLFFNSSNVPDVPFDYKLSNNTEWSAVKSSVVYERENGAYYIGYSVEGQRELSGCFHMDFRTQVKTAKNISSQSLIVSRGFEYFSVGGGMTAKRYSDPKYAFKFAIPLPGGEITDAFDFFFSPLTGGGGRLAFTTDFNKTHIWEGETQVDFPVSERVAPYLLGNYFSDGGESFWGIMGGIELTLRTEGE